MMVRDTIQLVFGELGDIVSRSKLFEYLAKWWNYEHGQTLEKEKSKQDFLECCAAIFLRHDID